MISSKTALLIIDVQEAIDDPKWGQRNNSDAEKRIAELLKYWRGKNAPIVHIRHDSNEAGSPYRQGQPLHKFKDIVKPLMGETVIGKSTNNAFVNTDLHKWLETTDIKRLVICGVLTQHSVDCTARMAASLGYKVTVVSDATAATEVRDTTSKEWSADNVHNLTLAHLAADYADIKITKELLV